jgi:hypothetical protein
VNPGLRQSGVMEAGHRAAYVACAGAKAWPCRTILRPCAHFILLHDPLPPLGSARTAHRGSPGPVSEVRK